ncbi:MAG: DUF2812 domain-containing protein, partial [Anaerotignum sp.]|nr:DUF2812 domain-containing protein [Anaerotignum sp.]
KRITRWKTGATKLQGAAYLREMAEQGWILEDMNHLMYTFREDEPQYLKYRILKRDCVMALEDREAYEKDGWSEACHYELEYVFVKKRDPFEEDSEEEKELVLEELDRKIKLERENEKSNNIMQISVIAIGGLVVFLMSGFSSDVIGITAKLVIKLLPWILLGTILSRRRLRKLHQEKEAVIEGEIPDEYTDWRGQRKGMVKGILLILAITIFWGYYALGKNKAVYDLPREIHYAEVPAPRLENIEDTELVRASGDIARQKAARGDHHWHIYDNSVTEKKNLFIEKPYSVEQKMAPVGEGVEITLSTDYCMYAVEILAEREYKKELKEEETSYPGINVSTQTVLDAPRGNFDGLHVCRREYVDETIIHILCRDGKQVMDLTYNGQAEVDDILMEIQKVFLAQK